jgi:hypothetical protein
LTHLQVRSSQFSEEKFSQLPKLNTMGILAKMAMQVAAHHSGRRLFHLYQHARPHNLIKMAQKPISPGPTARFLHTGRIGYKTTMRRNILRMINLVKSILNSERYLWWTQHSIAIYIYGILYGLLTGWVVIVPKHKQEAVQRILRSKS